VIWVIIGLLAIIALLLAFIAWRIGSGIEWIWELVRASGQANVRDLQCLGAKLDDIERHTARAAQPFYEADTDKLQHPERYPD
jgi:hypothetical protein